MLDLQRDALLAAGVDAGHLYEDHASGKRDDRPGLEACLKAVRSGDTLVAWKLDRLGRNLRHLVNLVGDLTKRDAGLRVLAGEGAAIDTTTSSSRLMFGFFVALAEFERELIVERTRAGLASEGAGPGAADDGSHLVMHRMAAAVVALFLTACPVALRGGAAEAPPSPLGVAEEPMRFALATAGKDCALAALVVRRPGGGKLPIALVARSANVGDPRGATLDRLRG